MNTLKKIIAARAALILDQPFFGALVLRLQLIEDDSKKTMATDGTHLFYNVAFVDSLTHHQLVAVLAHEVMHCANGHPWRRGMRESQRWNEACDRTINPILRESHFSLPSTALMELDPSHLGKSSEWVFDRIPPHPPQGGNGEQDNDPSGMGEVLDAPSTSPQTETEWKKATAQAAAAAKMRGHLPQHLKRFAEEVGNERVNWRSLLHRFVQEQTCADYSWTRPNRRYVPQGLYLPQLKSESAGPIAVAVDTSGSIDNISLGQFAREIRALVDEVQPSGISVLYCDAAVQHVDHFGKDEPVELHPYGGGGTDFRPVFQALGKLDETPLVLIYLTDMYGTFPEQCPDIPTLWITDTDRVAPFGETVRMED